jgi:preprotein translocase subunit SecA
VTVTEAPPTPPPPAPMVESHAPPGGITGGLALADPMVQAPALAQPLAASQVDLARPETWAATPRNAPCPCGSGKKFKYCHGRVQN